MNLLRLLIIYAVLIPGLRSTRTAGCQSSGQAVESSNQAEIPTEAPSATALEHLTARVDPDYPLKAKVAHVEGKVQVKVVISPEGTVTNAVALKRASTAHRKCDRRSETMALSAVRGRRPTGIGEHCD